MDSISLAQSLTGYLLPFLPFLTKAGDKVAEEAGKRLGGDGWDKTKLLWDRLWRGLKERTPAVDAVQSAAEDPSDQDAIASLRLQLRKVLEQDIELRHDLEGHWNQIAEFHTPQNAGDRNAAIGGNASNTTIVTGDRNRLG
jgi:hypothetical protein